MSRNGITQLSKVCVYFCDWGGSSKGMRQFLDQTSGAFWELAKASPEVKFVVQLRRGKHPFMKAIYKNGREHAHDCKNMDASEITQKLHNIKSQWGDKAKKIGAGKLTKNPSVQGLYIPQLWLKTASLARYNKQVDEANQ
ncbi:hypothetical protein C9374_002412 [Naegleria lovaniensis]|uniref:Large ribosomal subunit protein mL43 n=1 Tax=Naegleria lovaniensis TaxID=51637 RepID=A0AA88GVD6_NAELO|nr:uncharacterized protein C9374_002412 [Naegleria lovaniensis]KAG2386668.1 hypothetical protein C9374_002412 [Naegleria lovaniensis]